jgi:hypothetical protein
VATKILHCLLCCQFCEYEIIRWLGKAGHYQVCSPLPLWNSSSVNLIILHQRLLHTVLWYVSTFFLGLESSSISPYVVKLFTIIQEIITTWIHKGFVMSAVQLNLSHTTDNTSTHKVTVSYL